MPSQVVGDENNFGGAAGQEAIDAAFVIINTFIIFTMQSGFGLLESGKHDELKLLYHTCHTCVVTNNYLGRKTIGSFFNTAYSMSGYNV